MATLTMGSAGNYTWYLDYTTSQSVSLNRSTISYTLRIRRNVASNWGAWWGSPARTFNVTINGSSDSEGFASVDFRNSQNINFTSGSVNVSHSADGTKSPVGVSVSVSGSYVSSGFPVPTSLGGRTISLATIPRAATSITRSASTQTGSATTLALSPLVSGFNYVLEYKSPLTGTWTGIGSASGISGSSWPYSTTIAHGEIPNATSGTIQYRVTTLDGSGGPQIGSTTEASFAYTVPTSVQPTIGAPTWTEGASTAGLSTLTNSAAVFVKDWSKLIPTFTSDPGTGASTTTAVATVNGVSGNTTSGVAFANVVTTQGVGSAFSATVTDSRGRTDTETGTVSPAVHRWGRPIANAGTPVVTPTSTTQTIALSGTQATTTSFYLSGSQRNVLQTRVGYRNLTTAGAWVYGSWTSQALSSSDASDNAYAPGTAITVATGLEPSHEYEVTLQVRDIFGLNSLNYSSGTPYVESSLIVSAQDVLISLDGNTAVGIGKIPTQGILDVAGDVYATTLTQDGNAVVDAADLATTDIEGISKFATDAHTIAGTATNRAVTPDGLASLTALTTRRGLVELATDAETQAGSDAERAVTPSGLTARSVSLFSGSADGGVNFGLSQGIADFTRVTIYYKDNDDYSDSVDIYPPDTVFSGSASTATKYLLSAAGGGGTGYLKRRIIYFSSTAYLRTLRTEYVATDSKYYRSASNQIVITRIVGQY